MPKPSWQPHATKRDFSTRFDDVQISVFETQFDSYTYLVTKNKKLEAAGNMREATLEEAQASAVKLAEGF